MSNNFYRLVLYRTRQLFNWTMVNVVDINQFVAVVGQSCEKLVENFCGHALAKFNSKTGHTNKRYYSRKIFNQFVDKNSKVYSRDKFQKLLLKLFLT